LVAQVNSETSDVLAAIDHVASLPMIDQQRIGTIGWSLGGTITLFVASRTTRFRAAISQAPGFVVSAREAMIAAARTAQTPMLLMVAENDGAVTSFVSDISDAMIAAGRPSEKHIYPPYTPPEPVPGAEPGHTLFLVAGVSTWGGDAVAFFHAHLA
jgi:dienelactone hydrolase